MTDQRREQRTYTPRSAYLHYMYTTEMARRHERQRNMAQLDEEKRRDEAMLLKRMHDSRMKTEKAIREIRLEQERRLIKEEQKRQEHEERRRARRQNREELERELARIKNELKAELAKEDKKCQEAEEERQQHKEEERKMWTFIQQNEVSLKHTEGRQPVAALKRREHKQRNHGRMALAAGQIHVHEIIQDEIEEEDQRKDAERDNENEAFLEEKKRSDEEKETEVQTTSRKKSHEDAMSSDDTSQKDCTSCSIPYDRLNISCEKMTTLDVLHNTDRQEIPIHQTLGVCIAQECVSDDPIQSDTVHASLSDEQPQTSGAKTTNLKVHHVTDLQEKAMQRTLRMYIAEECTASDLHIPQSLNQLKILLGDSVARKIVYADSRDIMTTCKNSCLCFKFLWWQEGTLSS